MDKFKKLVCNLLNKKKYLVHIKSLKQALNHGLKLKKVHRIIEFNQKAWFKPYIDMNTELRKVAGNDFEKDFYKLMNNAVFRKAIDFRNQVNSMIIWFKNQFTSFFVCCY